MLRLLRLTSLNRSRIAAPPLAASGVSHDHCLYQYRLLFAYISMLCMLWWLVRPLWCACKFYLRSTTAGLFCVWFGMFCLLVLAVWTFRFFFVGFTPFKQIQCPTSHAMTMVSITYMFRRHHHCPGRWNTCITIILRTNTFCIGCNFACALLALPALRKLLQIMSNSRRLFNSI